MKPNKYKIHMRYALIRMVGLKMKVGIIFMSFDLYSKKEVLK